jgi:hypothetical protein
MAGTDNGTGRRPVMGERGSTEAGAGRWGGLGKRKKTWAEMSGAERAVVLVMASIQLALAAAAWADLAKRPAAQVNGPKGVWALAIAVNYVGPIAYFLKGRKPAA